MRLYMPLYIAGSSPPTDKGIFSDSAHIRPVVAIPETPTTGATQKPPGISNGLQREAPPRIVTKGVYETCLGVISQLTRLQTVHGSPAPDSGCRRICVCSMALGYGLPQTHICIYIYICHVRVCLLHLVRKA